MVTVDILFMIYEFTHLVSFDPFVLPSVYTLITRMFHKVDPMHELKKKRNQRARTCNYLGNFDQFDEGRPYHLFKTERGYIIIYETSPELVVFNVDEGIYLEVNLEKVFYLGKDHARIPAFAIQCAVQGVKPPRFNIWSRETCECFTDFINTACINFEVGKISGEVAVGDGISQRDGWSLVEWLVFSGRATHVQGTSIIYSHMEEE